MKTTLTPEQSATLIAKGISADKASEIKEYDDEVSKWTHRGAPIFTLADILDILPKEFNVNGTPARLQMYNHSAEYWIVSYVIYDGATLTYQKLCSTEAELIDALYSLLVWCLEKGYVKLD